MDMVGGQMTRKVVNEMLINVTYNEPYDMTDAVHHVTREELIKYYPDWEIDDLSPLNWSAFAAAYIRAHDNGAEHIDDWTIKNYSMMEIE